MFFFVRGKIFSRILENTGRNIYRNKVIYEKENIELVH